MKSKIFTLIVALLIGTLSQLLAQNTVEQLKEEVILHVRTTEYDKATILMEENIDIITNDTSGIFQILQQMYMHRKQWNKVLNLYSNRNVKLTGQDSLVITMGKVYAKYPPEQISLSTTEKISYATTRFASTLVDVVINGVKYKFWFDTGASFTVLSSKVAKKCNIKYDKNDYFSEGTSSGYVKAFPAVIDNFSVGNIKVQNHNCIILHKKDLQFGILGIPIVKIDGIIGWNFIQEFDVTMNDTAKTISFASSKTEIEGNNFFWCSQPIVSCTDSTGIPMQFLFDTGASYTMLYEPYLQKADTSKATKTIITIYGAGGKTKANAYKFEKVILNIDNSIITCKNITTKPRYLEYLKPAFELDGVLGKLELKGKIIHFNVEQGYLKLND